MEQTTLKARLKDFVLKNSEGFTIGFNLEKPTHKKGFYVGVTDNSNTNLNQAIDKLFKICEKDFKGVNKNSFFIGGWIDKNTNIFYLDLSVYIENKKNALLMAKLFKQKAIWDIKKQDSIYLN